MKRPNSVDQIDGNGQGNERRTRSTRIETLENGRLDDASLARVDVIVPDGSTTSRNGADARITDGLKHAIPRPVVVPRARIDDESSTRAVRECEAIGDVMELAAETAVLVHVADELSRVGACVRSRILERFEAGSNEATEFCRCDGVFRRRFFVRIGR